MKISLGFICLTLLGSTGVVHGFSFSGSGTFQAKLCAIGKKIFCAPGTSTSPTSSTASSGTSPSGTSPSGTSPSTSSAGSGIGSGTGSESGGVGSGIGTGEGSLVGKGSGSEDGSSSNGDNDSDADSGSDPGNDADVPAENSPPAGSGSAPGIGSSTGTPAKNSTPADSDFEPGDDTDTTENKTSPQEPPVQNDTAQTIDTDAEDTEESTSAPVRSVSTISIWDGGIRRVRKICRNRKNIDKIRKPHTNHKKGQIHRNKPLRRNSRFSTPRNRRVHQNSSKKGIVWRRNRKAI